MANTSVMLVRGVTFIAWLTKNIRQKNSIFGNSFRKESAETKQPIEIHSSERISQSNKMIVNVKLKKM